MSSTSLGSRSPTGGSRKAQFQYGSSRGIYSIYTDNDHGTTVGRLKLPQVKLQFPSLKLIYHFSRKPSQAVEVQSLDSSTVPR